MDWSIILDYAVRIVGVALGTLIATFATILFTKLKSKIGETKLSNFIDKCVRAAEQLYPNLGQKTGPEKLAYVLECVKAKYPKLDEGYLKTLIEGAVYSVSEEVKQIAKENKENASVTALKVN